MFADSVSVLLVEIPGDGKTPCRCIAVTKVMTITAVVIYGGCGATPFTPSALTRSVKYT